MAKEKSIPPYAKTIRSKGVGVEMKKEIVYDFVCDTPVSVVAEIGTDPSELTEIAAQMLLGEILLRRVDMSCDNVYDPTTGLYGHPDNVYEEFNKS